ncbi:hypothetical protein [Rhizobium yanglingense]
MPIATVSSRMLSVTEEMRTVMDFARNVLEGDGLGPDACDFMFGNPQETPLRGFVDALIRHVEPRMFTGSVIKSTKRWRAKRWPVRSVRREP